MSTGTSLMLIVALIAASAFFALAEICLAASRPLKLRQMADAGEPRAMTVLAFQQSPGPYFTVVQIGLNAVALLGGIVGEGAWTPLFTQFFGSWVSPAWAGKLGFTASFALTVSLFLIFADLFPKRVGMNQPERLAVKLVRPMQMLVTLLKPVIALFTLCTDALFRLFGLPAVRDDKITSADILALTEAGTEAGSLQAHEQQVIENLFDLHTRTVTSAMTPRDQVAWFDQTDSDAVIRARIADAATGGYSTYPVCDETLDRLLGYVDAKDLFQRVLGGQSINLRDPQLLHKALAVPEQLTLAEVLTQFRQVHEDFAVIVNEYSMVVGVITLNDVMSTVMGGLVEQADEELIVQRDADSWLIDGGTPVPDVMRALDLDEMPHADEYDTIAGFMMVMLRRIPRRTDRVVWGGYTFEVMDVDSFRIDQLMVTRQKAADNAT